MWHSRIFWRLFLASGTLIVVAIGILGFVIMGRIERHSLELITDTLQARSSLVREVVRHRPVEEFQDRITALGHEIGTRITLIAADGTVLADSQVDPANMQNHGNRP